MRTVRYIFIAALLAAFGALAAAQTAIGQADLSKLDATAADVDRVVDEAGHTNPSLATDAQKSLTDLRDVIAYLRVKLRREGTVSEAALAQDVVSMRRRVQFET